MKKIVCSLILLGLTWAPLLARGSEGSDSAASTTSSTTTTTIRPTTTTSSSTTTTIRPTSTTTSTTTIPGGAAAKRIVWEESSTGELEIWTVKNGSIVSKKKLVPPDNYRMRAYHHNSDGTYTVLWGMSNDCEEWVLNQNGAVLKKLKYRGSEGWTPKAYTD